MDKEKIKEAVNYAVDSNKVENNHLTSEEVDKIIEDINVSDDSFINGLVSYINNEKKEEGSNVKIRK